MPYQKWNLPENNVEKVKAENSEKTNFEKIKLKKKKMPRDGIIFHKCTKNYDYMLYCS